MTKPTATFLLAFLVGALVTANAVAWESQGRPGHFEMETAVMEVSYGASGHGGLQVKVSANTPEIDCGGSQWVYVKDADYGNASPARVMQQVEERRQLTEQVNMAYVLGRNVRMVIANDLMDGAALGQSLRCRVVQVSQLELGR